MTSLSAAGDVAVGVDAKRTSCCDVIAAADEPQMKTFKSITATQSADDGDAGQFGSDSDAAATFTGSDAFTSSTSCYGGRSGDHATQPITAGTERDSGTTADESVTGGNHQLSSAAGGLSSGRDPSRSSRDVTESGVNHGSSTSSPLAPSISETSTAGSSRSLFVNESRDHGDFPPPLALRSSADNASVSAAVGSDGSDRGDVGSDGSDRLGVGSGLLREEVATVGAAVVGVAVFWSLLAVAMCAVARVRKRKRCRRVRGGGGGGVSGDVDAQTAMMEAMIRAELARGRSRVADSRAPPTYVNVAEVIPPPPPTSSSSPCDLDMSDFFRFVLDNDQSDPRGGWRKHRHNDVISGPLREHPARWQDGDRTIHTRELTCFATTHRSLRYRRLLTFLSYRHAYFTKLVTLNNKLLLFRKQSCT